MGELCPAHTAEMTVRGVAHLVRLRDHHGAGGASVAGPDGCEVTLDEGSDNGAQRSFMAVAQLRRCLGFISFGSEMLSFRERNEEQFAASRHPLAPFHSVDRSAQATDNAREQSFSPVLRITSSISSRNEASVGYNDALSRSPSLSSASGMTSAAFHADGDQKSCSIAKNVGASTVAGTPGGVASRADADEERSGSGCGVSTGGAAALLGKPGGPQGREVDPPREEDEVVGVTAEGEFIYRCDVAEGPYRRRLQSLYQPIDQRLDQSTMLDGGEFLSATATGSSARRVAAGGSAASHAGHSRHHHYNGPWNPTHASERVAAHLTRGSPDGANHQFELREHEWTVEERESYNLLLRYRLCENEGEYEYEKLISSVSALQAAVQRKPMERLRRQLEQRERAAKAGHAPPLALRW